MSGGGSLGGKCPGGKSPGGKCPRIVFSVYTITLNVKAWRKYNSSKVKVNIQMLKVKVNNNELY
jgi:hypothetical protein